MDAAQWHRLTITSPLLRKVLLGITLIVVVFIGLYAGVILHELAGLWWALVLIIVGMVLPVLTASLLVNPNRLTDADHHSPPKGKSEPL